MTAKTTTELLKEIIQKEYQQILSELNYQGLSKFLTDLKLATSKTVGGAPGGIKPGKTTKGGVNNLDTIGKIGADDIMRQVNDTVRGLVNALDPAVIKAGDGASNSANKLALFSKRLKALKNADGYEASFSVAQKATIRDLAKAVDGKVAQLRKMDAAPVTPKPPKTPKPTKPNKPLKDVVANDMALAIITKPAKSADEAATQLAKIEKIPKANLNKIKGNKKAENEFAMQIYKKQKKAATAMKAPGKAGKKVNWRRWLAAAGLVIGAGTLYLLMKKDRKKAVAATVSGRIPATSYYCRRMEKSLAKFYTQYNSTKARVKSLQTDLVNLGFSVKKDRGPTPFKYGLTKQGGMVDNFTTSKKLVAEFKLYGIDGDCGSGTKWGIEDLQTFLVKEKGYDLGTYGPKGDGVDGILGQMTWDGIQKLMKELMTLSSDEDLMIKHPSLKKAAEANDWDAIFNTYVATEHEVWKNMIKKAEKKYLGTGGSKEEKDEIRSTAALIIQQIGFKTLADQRRVPIYGSTEEGKAKAGKEAAVLIDKMFNEPQVFSDRSKKMGYQDYLSDPSVIKQAARKAIIRVLDNDPNMEASITEWKEFDRFSRLWN